jgi:hypothetical protein
MEGSETDIDRSINCNLDFCTRIQLFLGGGGDMDSYNVAYA